MTDDAKKLDQRCINTIRTLSMIGMHTFGASAPLKELQKKFGFTPENLVTTARKVLGKAR